MKVLTFKLLLSAFGISCLSFANKFPQVQEQSLVTETTDPIVITFKIGDDFLAVFGDFSLANIEIFDQDGNLSFFKSIESGELIPIKRWYPGQYTIIVTDDQGNSVSDTFNVFPDNF